MELIFHFIDNSNKIRKINRRTIEGTEQVFDSLEIHSISIRFPNEIEINSDFAMRILIRHKRCFLFFRP